MNVKQASVFKGTIAAVALAGTANAAFQGLGFNVVNL